MVTIFALTAAILYGSADFLGGFATRHARVLSVLPLSAAAGTVIVLVASIASGQPIRAEGLAWGLAAGVVGGFGLMVFYAGLAAGPMSVVAPVSALVSTILPVGVALADGERASAIVSAGALVCLIAVVLVSSSERKAAAGASAPGLRGLVARSGVQGRAVAYGVGAGTAFGLFFLFIKEAGHSGTLWPIAAARVSGFVLVVIAATITKTRPVLTGVSGPLLLATVGSGAVDATANVFYIVATHSGLFGLAVVLTSLYPGVTVLLARLTLGERLRAAQQIGLLLACLGVVLVTA
jgi:drug/metabolite transporter (DMT)-like permease